jgi:hypothetical protein
MSKDCTDVIAILTKRLGFKKQEAFLPPHTIPIQMIEKGPAFEH